MGLGGLLLLLGGGICITAQRQRRDLVCLVEANNTIVGHQRGEKEIRDGEIKRMQREWRVGPWAS